MVDNWVIKTKQNKKWKDKTNTWTLQENEKN